MQKLFAIVALLAFSLLTPTRFDAQSPCPVSRLAIGNTAVVEFKPSVELRSEPEGGRLLAKITWYVAIEGPICAASGTLWWKAQAESGAVGYAPEGRGRTYWIYPLPTKVPVTTLAAYQPFENGYMIWRYDSGGISVFFGKNGGSKFAEYRNRSYARLRDNPVTARPPAGLIKPINGFGKLWGNFNAVRQQLGWAVGEEQTYTLTISHPYPGVNAEYYTLPDGRSIRTYSHLVRYWGFQ